jgi:hypothetical protein
MYTREKTAEKSIASRWRETMPVFSLCRCKKPFPVQAGRLSIHIRFL